MTKTAKPPMIERNKEYVRELADAIRLAGEVSPCVFMYTGYPLQVGVTLTGKAGEALGTATLSNRKLNAKTAVEADVDQLFASARTKPCNRCQAPAFDPSTVETNRDGLCERCFMDDLNREYAEAALREIYKTANRDRQMRAKGMRFRITAWIHADEGDDEQIDWYFRTRPKAAKIRKLLRNEGSEIMDDYEIARLARTRQRVE